MNTLKIRTAAFALLNNLRRKVPTARRVRIHVTGIVQGVGFRPFIFGLAQKHNLKGYCLNGSEGVIIEVEGAAVNDFIRDMVTLPPPLARIEDLSIEDVGSGPAFTEFSIRESVPEEGKFTLISPDIATCGDCLRELFDPGDRRYLYPFINCTNCGPRYSIVLDIPYDRPKTTMAGFMLCEECAAEYHDPSDRRFHAQPNACGRCGPKLWLDEAGGLIKNSNDEINYKAVQMGARLLKQGAIIAVKGLGGFHLACDAANDDAVKRLRERKRRSLIKDHKEGSNKPFALMAPDIKAIEGFCFVSDEEKTALEEKTRPIVIMEKRSSSVISEGVSPNNNYLGCMLPYTPLHHLLFNADGISFTALVMTSGNLSEEPIVISNDEALEKLSPLADFFLLHNRPIYMRTDDSIVKKNGKAIQVLRRARGLTPEPIDLGEEMDEILATGGELKNTLCLTKGRYAVMSQHIGDLENFDSLGFFKETLRNLKNSFRVEPRFVAYDMHPDYLSTRFAHEYFSDIDHPDKDMIPVQHHHAHVVSCMAEHNLSREVIGIAFDGTGFGLDGSVWGGEFMFASRRDFLRRAHLEYVPLPGGDMAVKEPWRTGLSFLYYAFGDELFEEFPRFFERFEKNRVEIVLRMIKNNLNSPLTSSCGRLFDGVSSILGIRDMITFEGEAAIELEMIAGSDPGLTEDTTTYPFRIVPGKTVKIDTRPVIKGIVEDFLRGTDRSVISLRFHHTVAGIIQSVARLMSAESRIEDVVLSGGVFQNRLLTNITEERLKKDGFNVWTHERVPTNDGGIALGQAVVAWENIKGLLKT